MNSKSQTPTPEPSEKSLVKKGPETSGGSASIRDASDNFLERSGQRIL